ncbi:MAG: DUF5320 domain-containing protein [Elusimicrobia bacterium]|nr:DUF5320 domain-containing protein [Elusimicrobiota bacterium]
MPGGDRTGPEGMGPMTGRGAGYCAGYDVPGYMNPAGWGGYPRYGRGFGGRGRGFRHRFFAAGMPGWARGRGWYGWGTVPYDAPQSLDPASEKEGLKRESEYLKKELQEIQSRIKELEKDKVKEKKS